MRNKQAGSCLPYRQHFEQRGCIARTQDFGRNYAGDPKVKIPWVRADLSGGRVLVMEWIDGLRCTDPAGIQASGIDVNEFIRCGVVSGLRQLLEARMRSVSFLLVAVDCRLILGLHRAHVWVAFWP